MCVALPAMVTAVDVDGQGIRPGICDLDGRLLDVDLGLVPDVTVGDYVIVHSGYAIRVIAADEAAAVRRLIDDQWRVRPQADATSFASSDAMASAQMSTSAQLRKSP